MTTKMVEPLLRLALREFFASDAPLANAEDAELFRAQMLRSSDDVSAASSADTDDRHTTITVDQVLSGFATAVPVEQLAVILASWHATNANPLLQLPAAIDGVAEVPSNRDALLSLSIEAIDGYVQQTIDCEVRSFVKPDPRVVNNGPDEDWDACRTRKLAWHAPQRSSIDSAARAAS